MGNSLYSTEDEQKLLNIVEQLEDEVYFRKATEQTVVGAIKGLLQVELM